jgi:PIN domain nuclease of toxin-antitoxin system
MNILLDTHIFLWYISGNKRLDSKHRDLISDEKNDVFLSAISIWECCIKQQIGKLEFPSEAAHYLSEKRELHQILALPVDEGCLSHLSSLPVLHKDPFDRILICQSISNKMKLITKDQLLKQYKITGLSFL